MIVLPPDGVEADGYAFLGRGPGASDASGAWSRSPELFFRCASCGDFMQASRNDYYTCSCSAMHLDFHRGRLGSTLGDQNILVYRRLDLLQAGFAGSILVKRGKGFGACRGHGEAGGADRLGRAFQPMRGLAPLRKPGGFPQIVEVAAGLAAKEL